MLPEYVKYYYNKLPEQKKNVYMQMYKGFRAHQELIDITVDTSQISPEDLLYIFECLYNDTPSFYFLQVANSRWIMKTETGYIFRMQYQYTEADIERFDKQLVDGLQIFKSRYIQDNMTAFEKEIVIHDYLIRTVTYDHESVNSDAQMARHGEIFNVLGPLLRKKAVCWGIACAFKLICDYCGIKCFVVTGRALNAGKDSDGHAWNIVRLDNDNYHVDVTWDIKKKGDITFIYDYLNLNDALIRLDHTWDDRIYPPCTSLEYNYHRRNRLFVRTLQEIPNYVRNAIKLGEKYITFKYANDLPPIPDIQRAIIKGIMKARYKKRFVIAINPETHNIYIDLKQK